MWHRVPVAVDRYLIIGLGLGQDDPPLYPGRRGDFDDHAREVDRDRGRRLNVDRYDACAGLLEQCLLGEGLANRIVDLIFDVQHRR